MGTFSLRIESESEHITRQIAGRIAQHISGVKKKKRAYVVLLKGDLGSGKTTFTKGVLNYFGVRPRAASPTFVIMKRYEIGAGGRGKVVKVKNKKENKSGIETMYHIDAYRLHSKKDLDVLGVGDILVDPQALICIEWPEKVRGIERNADLVVRFEHGENEHQRIITIKKAPTKSV